jgi:L-ascorbate metabolism protein UlaG (beta-lactamase superfamily)
MSFAETAFYLEPERPAVPCARLLQELRRIDFEPARTCAKIEALVAEQGLDPRWFDLAAAARGGALASDFLLYGAHASSASWTWSMRARGGRPASVSLSANDVPIAAELIRQCTFGDDPEGLRALCREALGPDLSAALWPSTPRRSAAGRWPRVDAPGIYRREHASLVFRSRTTTVVIDPQGGADGWTTDGGRYPADEEPLAADAVLVTHHHGDHWHLPSILRLLATPDAPVIVPRVPRPSLLCSEDMAASLAAAGQAALSPPWWSSVTVGDFVIDVLPFHGEQPLRGGGPLGDLRSWGNCYRLTCPELSVIVLADSGADAEGDTAEVLARSAAERGPVDILASSCLDFPEGDNLGLPHYFLTVPLATLHRKRRAPHERGTITLGPSGVARAAAVTGARFFLPYAHGFRGIGAPPIGAEQGSAREAEQLRHLAAALAALGARTEVLAWSPGDVARIEGGRVRVIEAPLQRLP